MRRPRVPLVAACLAVLTIAGCGSSSAGPTTVPTRAPTPVPPTPTQIDLTLPSIIGQYLIGARVTRLETFETLDPATWQYAADWVTTSNNQLQVLGEDGWAASLSYLPKLGEKTAVFFRFQADFDAEYGAYVESAPWGTPGYDRFGIYGFQPELNIFRDGEALGRDPLDGALALQPDVWYDMLLAVGQGPEFVAVIWDPNDSTQRQDWRGSIGEGLVGQAWTFSLAANHGYLWIDDFAVLSFSDLTH